MHIIDLRNPPHIICSPLLEPAFRWGLGTTETESLGLLWADYYQNLDADNLPGFRDLMRTRRLIRWAHRLNGTADSHRWHTEQRAELAHIAAWDAANGRT